MRECGILLPISSLPSPYGIGSFSKEAYQFIDWLKQAGQRYWQILPLGPTGYGDSPYQSFSTFAGNPYFIDLDDLVNREWLTREDCQDMDYDSSLQYVDYEKIYLSRFRILEKAFHNSSIEQDPAFQIFAEENAYWLNDYALYMAVKNSFNNISFCEWDEDIRLRTPRAIEEYSETYKDTILFYQFQQYMFFTQWKKLKAYANRNGIKIIGDIPIYVAYDSADTWASPELFQLDRDNNPTAVAGCPPDAFAATGQLWGNPLYNWDYHKSTGYEWWVKRIRYCLDIYDVVRVDHFRGFDEYYSIPYGDKTAENGSWKKGPGYDIFKTFRQQLGKVSIIAEDLGYLTQSVIDLVENTGYPGMKVLQFAFDSREAGNYLPHNYDKNCVVYTGTHDNDTIIGWYQAISKEDRELSLDYMNNRHTPAGQIHWDFIRLALSSVANLAVIPLQDYLGLPGDARMNTPSTLGGNWQWRLPKDGCTTSLAEKIKNLTKLYGRL